MAGKATESAKLRYKVLNWREYNAALVRRGDVTLWFDESVVAAWDHANGKAKVGRPFVYSDLAIETLLTLREIFRLPYRQTEGFGKSLAKLMAIEIAIPDFTSLAKRAAKLNLALDVAQAKGPLDVVVDSTGLKVYGEGEWKVRRHGTGGKRRTWRKVHLAIDPATQELVAETLTENSGHDADQAQPLLAQIQRPIMTFTGDGAYDKWKVYDELARRGVQPLIPPQRNAKIKRHGNSADEPLPRDEAIRGIRAQGRSGWKKEVGYHRRSLGETAMYRMKRCFGDKLKNRNLDNQRIESRLRANVLNKFTRLGMPLADWS
ncbi:MAG: IS5 family transposase [Pirellulales bacterium]|nr:IS5 family transposase [Pirellulales bacterium]